MENIEIIINKDNGEEAYYLSVKEAFEVYKELKKLFSYKEEKDEKDI